MVTNDDLRFVDEDRSEVVAEKNRAIRQRIRREEKRPDESFLGHTFDGLFDALHERNEALMGQR